MGGGFLDFLTHPGPKRHLFSGSQNAKVFPSALRIMCKLVQFGILYDFFALQHPKIFEISSLSLLCLKLGFLIFFSQKASPSPVQKTRRVLFWGGIGGLFFQLVNIPSSGHLQGPSAKGLVYIGLRCTCGRNADLYARIHNAHSLCMHLNAHAFTHTHMCAHTHARETHTHTYAHAHMCMCRHRRTCPEGQASQLLSNRHPTFSSQGMLTSQLETFDAAHRDMAETKEDRIEIGHRVSHSRLHQIFFSPTHSLHPLGSK